MIRGLLAVLALVLAVPSAAGAAPRVKSAKKSRAKAPSKGSDPSRWFATRAGLIRVYEERGAPKPEGGPAPAGASCEVLESKASGEAQVAQTRELCTMIVARKPKAPTELTYELRRSGVFLVKALVSGKAQPVERMLLPGSLRVGSTWNESRGQATFVRRVKSAGSKCKVERREFGDCLVVAVQQKRGGKTVKRFTETYAAGVGLIEDAQWRLIDVQGL